MARTIITLEDADKKWLDRYSSRHNQSAAETVRFAIKQLQNQVRAGERAQVLKTTAGILKGQEDSVTFVRQIRKEWE